MTSAEKGEGSRNAANLRANSIDFADKEGEKGSNNLRIICVRTEVL